MKSKDIVKNFIQFYKEKDHKEVPNVSLVPENDPTLLYVNSGMFPLVPYLMGEPHALGTRLVNVQRCLRFFEDLENVGNTIRHTTAFHMLGNWSLNDYFKKEQLNWAWEFYVDVLGLDIRRMYATVFKGDADAPRDEESIEILKDIFAQRGIEAKVGERIFTYDKKENWWQRGDAIGELGGPDSEIYYFLGENWEDGVGKDPAEHDDVFLEVGNSVFIQYRKEENGWKEIPKKNVDFGGGLERLALVAQGKTDIYETDNFWPIIQKIQEISGKVYGEDPQTKKAMAMTADHIRSATFLAMDGVFPSNKELGYVLRRLIRRMVRAGKTLGVERDLSVNLVGTVVEDFSWLYPELIEKRKNIESTFAQEEEKFRKVLDKGMREAAKRLENFKGSVNELVEIAFDLKQSLGYPEEMFWEDIKHRDYDLQAVSALFAEKEKQHQDKSRSGAEEKFAGGLADQSEQTIKYHTATHLLHWALREVLGDHVHQMGSNITGKRLRFDFSHADKLTEDEIAKVEKLVNGKIADGVSVNYKTLSKEEAEKTGALHFFGEKYGEKVNVYYIGTSIEEAFSKEFCGGPHVANTSEIGEIEIFKQKKIGENLVRIYAQTKL